MAPDRGLRAAVFIDRDGVINAERDYVHRIEDFEVLPGVFEGLRRLAAQGFALVIVTNQAGIAKGRYDEAAYERLTQHLRALFAAQGIGFDGIYHCPHHPQGTLAAYRRECDCRKPAPGMLRRAAQELGLDLARSAIVGDKPSDTEAGRAAGLRFTVLVASGHRLPHDAAALADQVCADLADAADWLCAPEQLLCLGPGT
jgi:D-glycero-D-manno-heptose 1,7-bisphosphate phosphatase